MRKPPLDELAPLLLKADDVARLLGCSSRFVWTMHAGGTLPTPVRLSNRFVRWRRAELEQWIEAGTPPREKWEILRKRNR